MPRFVVEGVAINAKTARKAVVKYVAWHQKDVALRWDDDWDGLTVKVPYERDYRVTGPGGHVTYECVTLTLEVVPRGSDV